VKKLILGIALVIPIFILVLLYFFGKNTYKVRNAQNVPEACAGFLQDQLQEKPLGIFLMFSKDSTSSDAQFLTRLCDALPYPEKISFFSNRSAEQSSNECGFMVVSDSTLCHQEPALYLVNKEGFAKEYPFNTVYFDTLIVDSKVLLKP